MTLRNSPLSGTLIALAAVIVTALAFGGGGSKYGLLNLIVILAALIALAFHRRAFFEFWGHAPIALRLLVAASLLLPTLYLIPLPPSVWSALPGRELIVQSHELVGETIWGTASVNPVRTLLALTALITPLAVLAIGWAASREHLISVGWIVVALGIANVALGIPQVLSNSEFGVLYPENPMPGVLFGTFANRNSTGLFLVGVLALAALLPLPKRVGSAGVAIRLGLCALLFLAIILTRSRTALVLALLPLGIAGMRAFLVQFARDGTARSAGMRKLAPVMVGAGVIAIVFGSVLIVAPGRLSDTLERFAEDRTNSRTYIWEDAAYSAQRYWPVGAGTGSFDDVYQVDESLENMTPLRAGRAHNDYLEAVIETGIAGAILITAWIALLAWLSWRARRSPDRWIAWSGAAILFAIALQSITDYPLRNQSLLAIGGYALLLLARFSTLRTGSTETQVAK